MFPIKCCFGDWYKNNSIAFQGNLLFAISTYLKASVTVSRLRPGWLENSGFRKNKKKHMIWPVTTLLSIG